MNNKIKSASNKKPIGIIIELFLSILFLLISLAQIILIILIRVTRPKKRSQFPIEDISIIGLELFDFIEDKTIPEYPNDNLGITGKLILDCHIGYCTQEIFHEVYKIYCDDDNDCYEGNESWTEYIKIIDHNCSEQCYEKGENDCRCDKPYDEIGICERKKDDKYIEGKICYADNEIYFWKGKKYKILNISNFSCLNDIILKNEECPEGKKNCGIIDDNENKLCIKSNLKCPINYLSEQKLSNDFSSVLIGDKTFYYGNDNTTKRKIIAGLFVDSDLLLNDDSDKKDIIDNYTISGFLEDNQNLYKDINLGYNPYETNDIDKKGKSYLRIIYNERNIDLISLRNRRDKLNSYNEINNNSLNTLYNKINVIIVLGILSYFSLLLVFIHFISDQYKICKDGAFDEDKRKLSGGYICLFVIIFGLVLTPLIFGCINISKVNNIESINHIEDYSTFKNLNIAFIIIGFSLIVFFIVYVALLPIKCCDELKEEKNNENENIDKNINSTTFDNKIHQSYVDTGMITERDKH